MTSGSNDFHWAVDFPGMTEDEARRLAEAHDIGALGYGLVADPAIFWTAHLDRATVEVLRAALDADLSRGTDESIAASLRDMLERWLAQANE